MAINIIGLIIASAVLILTIIGAGWRVGFLLGKLTQEVKGHNKRLDMHAELLENLRKEIKTVQIDRHHGG